MLDWLKEKLLDKLMRQEFQVAVLTPVVGYLATKLDLPDNVLMAALLSLAGVAMAFIHSRGVSKAGTGK